MSIEEKIKIIFENVTKIPDEFFVKAENDERVIWFLDREDGTAESYETSQERFGMTKNGDVIWGFSSGCSCWSGWKSGDYCPTKSYKEFKFAELKFETGWEENIRIDDILLLIKEDITPLEILQAKNAEVRRYLIKRIGYENLKSLGSVTVLHQDGTSELIEFNKEKYVKVKDSSTDREYLLYVPNNIKTCRAGIAWTFGLSEEEYKPLIET